VLRAGKPAKSFFKQSYFRTQDILPMIEHVFDPTQEFGPYSLLLPGKVNKFDHVLAMFPK
jgi:hypothetical protein